MPRACRRIAAFLVLFVVCAGCVQAQTLVGVKIGPVFSQLKRGVAADERDGLVGFAGGGFMAFHSGSAIGLQVGLLSSQKGAKIDDPASAEDGKLKLSYIELPVNVRIGMKGKGPYVYGGPQIAVESKCEIENTVGTARIANDCNNQGSAVFKRRKFEVSAVAGAGFRYALGKTGARNILLEVSHTWGLTNLNKESDDAFVKNRALAVYLGYATFPAKRKH